MPPKLKNKVRAPSKEKLRQKREIAANKKRLRELQATEPVMAVVLNPKLPSPSVLAPSPRRPASKRKETTETPPRNTTVISPTEPNVASNHRTTPFVALTEMNEVPTPIRHSMTLNVNVNDLSVGPIIPIVNEVTEPATVIPTVNEFAIAPERPPVAATKRLKQANQCTPLNISNAFLRGKHDYDKILNPIDNGASNKSDAMTTFRTNLFSLGTLERQAACIVEYCVKDEPRIGLSLNMFDNPDKKWLAAEKVMSNLSKILDTLKGQNNNEARSMRNILLNCILPTAPPDSATEEVKSNHKSELKLISEEFGFSKGMKKQVSSSTLFRKKLFNGEKVELFQKIKRDFSQSKRTRVQAMREDFHRWLFEVCPLVIASPNKKDTVLERDKNSKPVIVRDEFGEPVPRRDINQKIMLDKNGNPKPELAKVRKYFYSFSHREIYDYATRPVSQGGFPGFRDPQNPNKIWVCQNSMVSILPHNIKRMTDSQKAMCGCEVCLDAQSFIAALKEYRTKLRKIYLCTIEKLAEKGRTNELEAVEKAKDEWEKSVFVHTNGVIVMDSENSPKHKVDTMAQYVEQNTCPKIACGEGHLYHCLCVLNRCLVCTPTPIPPGEEIGHSLVNIPILEEEPCSDEEIEDGIEKVTEDQNPCEDPELAFKLKYEKFGKNDMVVWKMHRNVYECKTHGPIPPCYKEKSKCPKCQLLKKENRDEAPKAKLQRIQMRRPIGEFHQILQSFVDLKFRQHDWLVEIIGPRWCMKDRDPIRLLFLDPFSVIMIRDYTDRISMDYNKSAMSVGMGGGNPTVGMEGFLYYHRQKYMGIKFKALLKPIEEEQEQDVLAV